MANTVYCDHCSQYVSRKTAYNHRKKQLNSKNLNNSLSNASSCREENPVEKQDNRKVLCLHCNKYVCRKTLYRHRKKNRADGYAPGTRQETSVDYDSSTDEEISPNVTLDVSASQLIEEDSDSSTASEAMEPSTASEAMEVDEDSETSIWDEEEDSAAETDLTSKGPEDQIPKSHPLLEWLLYSIVFLQNLYFLSNACIEQILFVFAQFLAALAPYNDLCSSLKAVFPKSLYKLRQMINFSQDDFVKYVVCPNCSALHSYDEVLRNGQLRCQSEVFACRAINSSRKRGRAKCNAILARQVILKDKREVMYPYKLYCMKGVISGLERLLQRPDFLEKCSRWRNRNVIDFYADIYDGKVWKSFLSKDGTDFLEKDYHFGFALNVDWFSPYKRRSDVSVGALYMVVLNLPREDRFKTENAILLGVIPALKKEPESLNSFLKPIVDELKVLWRGILLNVNGYKSPVIVKAALMCAAADIPAARKLCGFMGHSANQGCSHCTKPFIHMSEKDCGVPNVDVWPLRNRSDHVKYSALATQAESLTAKRMIEGRYGYRYTVLLELDYFVPSQFYAIDPMHNLFLGTAKRLFCHWVDENILTRKALQSVSHRISLIQVDYDIGRIPQNIVSNHCQMTAKEWKNWILIYSMYALVGNLPLDHLKVWQTFVLACRHLCKPVITRESVSIAHGLFVKFVKEVMRLYGSQFVTPNMHLHCHLKDCVENFGTIYGFWLFSFERYNGILSGFPTNKRSIECQLMRKFEFMNGLNPLCVDDNYIEKLKELFDRTSSKHVATTTLCKFMCPSLPIDAVEPNVWSDLSSCSFKSQSFKLVNLSQLDIVHLSKVYSVIYDEDIDTSRLNVLAKKYAALEYCSVVYGSNAGSNSRDIVWASWSDEQSNIKPSCVRPAKIKYFLVHSIELVPGSIVSHVFAVVDWFKVISQTTYLPPFSVWSVRSQNEGPACFLPAQRIMAKCAWARESINGRPCLVACEVPLGIYA